MGNKAWESRSLFLSQEAKAKFSRIPPPIMIWTLASEEAPINLNKYSTINFPRIINCSFFFVSDHCSGSRATSRDAHNRLNILHLITFKQVIVFTVTAVRKEESFQSVCVWLEENRINPRLHKKWHFLFPDSGQGKPDSASLTCSFVWGLRIQVLI